MYVELVTGSLLNRGKVLPLDELPMESTVILQKTGSFEACTISAYRSLFCFGEDFKAFVEKTGSVANYPGLVYLQNVVMDIDDNKKADLLSSTKDLLHLLFTEWELTSQEVKVYFSGVGFHILIPNVFGLMPSPGLPATLTATMLKHFPFIDHIYNTTRLIRLQGSYNKKSGLYKIPLTHEEINTLSLDQIKELAKQPRPWQSEDLPFSDKWKDRVERPISIALSDAKAFEPTAMVTCVQKMFQQGAETGSRHVRMLRMVSAWRRFGIPQTACENILLPWSTLTPQETRKIINDVYVKGYKWGCQDPVMSEFCDPKCVYFKNRNFLVRVATGKEMLVELAKFIATDFTDTCIDLERYIHLGSQKYRIFPGELVIVWGDTGIGKSAWVQNIVTNMDSKRILYYNFEFDKNVLFNRFLQIKMGETSEDVHRHILDGEAPTLDHIVVVTENHDLKTIERTILQEKPEVVIIDTLDGVSSFISDPLMKMEDLAVQLKALAIRHGLMIIVVHHISKAAAIDPQTQLKRRLTIHSGKGASAIPQKADKVIGIEASSDTLRKVTSLKNRTGPGFTMTYRINWDTFTYETTEGRTNDISSYGTPYDL